MSDAIEQYVATKVVKGREDSTIAATRSALHMMLAPYLQRPIRSIDGRGEELYKQAQVYPSEHDRAGQGRHRVWLTRAKGFGKWCVKQGWLKGNPFAPG